MANTFKFGNKNWAVKKDSVLAYNDENNNFKPLPFDFTRDSTATYVDSDGLIKTAGQGEARIDYLDNADGHLLLEPARTNLVTYSEDFSNAAWVKFNTTITANTVVSPDGTQTADRIESTNASHLVYFQSTVIASTKYTFSYFFKEGTKDSVKVAFYDNTANSFITQDATQETVDYGNGWKRIIATVTTPSGCVLLNSYLDRSSGIGTFYAWGAQLEEGYATSYIPTEGSSVTRSADACSGAGNSEVFNDSEGVLYAEISALSNDLTFRLITLSDGTTNNRISFGYRNTSNAIYCEIRNASVTQAFLLGYSEDIKNLSKVAVKYKENDFALWINGVEVATDSSGITPLNLNKLTFDSGQQSGSFFYGNAKDVRVYNTALTDSELETLTT